MPTVSTGSPGSSGDGMRSDEADRVAAAELLLKLRSLGIADTRLLSAMEAVPRRFFMGARYQQGAYLDRPVPIECGQTMSAPSTVAKMVTALEVKPEHKVLEVGCGSGYQTAVLAKLADRVVTLDRFRSLIELAEDRFTALKIGNVTAIAGDGLDGFPRHAPYDRILVAGAMEKVPSVLMDQLADRGVLVAPVGSGAVQTLVRIFREGRLLHRRDLGTVRFVPLVEGVAQKL